MTEQPRRRGRPPRADAPAGTVQVLDRALTLMGHIADAGAGGVTLTELSALAGQPPSTVDRLLASLAARGMVETDPATQIWHIGPETYRMGAAFLRRGGLAERAAPILRRLMQATSETANLGICDGDAVLIVAQAETPRPIRATFPPGARLPLAQSGLGRAMLACGDDAPDHPELTAARARGYALDREEVEPGMHCVAAAVLDPAGRPVAAISISGPAHRVGPAHLKTLGAAVTEAARQLSEAIGGQPADTGPRQPERKPDAL